MTKKFIRYGKDGKPIEKEFPNQRNQKEQIEFEKQLFETAGWQPADAIRQAPQPKKQTREELLRLLGETEEKESEDAGIPETQKEIQQPVKLKYTKK